MVTVLAPRTKRPWRRLSRMEFLIADLSKPLCARKPPSSVVVSADSRNDGMTWNGTQSGVPGPVTISTFSLCSS
jgi:hypothetical protein